MVANGLMTRFQTLGRSPWLRGRIVPVLAGVLVAAHALTMVGCSAPDPKALLKVSEVETYWVVDPSRTDTRYLAPAVRFRVENVSKETLLAVDATAAFRRDGSEDSWGSGYFQLTEGRKKLAPGARVLVTMTSDARYAATGAPEQIFTNPGFKPVNVRFFLRVGSSVWAEFGRGSVENVLGSKDARALIRNGDAAPR